MAEKGRKAAIVGSGLIGKCWATLFARAGYSVVVYDILFSEQSKIDECLKAICDQLSSMEREKMLWNQKADEVKGRIAAVHSLEEALNGAVYVQECVPEKADLKKKIFSEIDKIANDSVILASSSSCIVPSSFTSDLVHRRQCVVAHPVNPPYYIPVVEVVPAPYTDPAITERVQAILKELGQKPVLVKKEVNGFILNRLQYALLMESWRLVEDGIATVEDVDTAIRDGLGLRYSFMGPFEIMHLNANGVVDHAAVYGPNITRICESQTPARDLLSGPTLDHVKTVMEGKIPLDKLGERRKWRDQRLAALALHKREMEQEDLKQ